MCLTMFFIGFFIFTKKGVLLLLNDKYITVVEFGKMLKIGRNKAYEIVKKDATLPTIRIDRKILINKTKLDLWLKNKEQTSINI